MNKWIKKLEFIGFILVCVFGTVLHFVYDWTNENSFVALFVPVNESVWEHLKLIFFPYTIYAIYETIKLKNNKFNIFFAKAIGVSAGMLTTLCIYYLITGITGRQISAVNIASFFIGVAAAYLISYLLLTKSIGKGIINGIAIVYIIILVALFMYLTYHPVEIPLFLDPQTNTYSIKS